MLQEEIGVTKEEVLKLLVLIESVYPNCICKDETVLQWFQFCSKMDYEKGLTKLKNHIRINPFPPSIGEIAVFPFEENHLPATLQEWMEVEREKIECNPNSKLRGPIPGLPNIHQENRFEAEGIVLGPVLLVLNHISH
jgi:hypothetical protein